MILAANKSDASSSWSSVAWLGSVELDVINSLPVILEWTRSRFAAGLPDHGE